MPIARCQCGGLTAEVDAWSPAVVACHCTDCQRRSGSPFGVGYYYPAAAVTITGTAREFGRDTDAGNRLTNHFCPDCGTTLWWTMSRDPDVVAIAAGSFADPSAPPPIRSVWEERAHSWSGVAVAVQHFPRGTR